MRPGKTSKVEQYLGPYLAALATLSVSAALRFLIGRACRDAGNDTSSKPRRRRFRIHRIDGADGRHGRPRQRSAMPLADADYEVDTELGACAMLRMLTVQNVCAEQYWIGSQPGQDSSLPPVVE